MGMTVKCSRCEYTGKSSSRRGAVLGACPEPGCGGQLQAHTAGKARGRYTCPVSGDLVTLGLTGVQIAAPMRVAVIAEGGRYHGRELGPPEREWLVNGEGKVYGPGCVVKDALDPDRESPFTPRVTLVPAPGTDPATWIVNEQLQYRKCKGCGASIAVSDTTRMTREWTPKRSRYSRRGGTRATNPGPHPAGTHACPDCHPGENPA